MNLEDTIQSAAGSVLEEGSPLGVSGHPRAGSTLEGCSSVTKQDIPELLHSHKRNGRELKLNKHLLHFPSGAGLRVTMGYFGAPQLQKTNGPSGHHLHLWEVSPGEGRLCDLPSPHGKV